MTKCIISWRFFIDMFSTSTHWVRNKMAAFSQTTFSRAFSWIMNKFAEDFTEVCSKVQIDSNPALVQMMVWCRPGDKSLSEPMLTQFTDAYVRHWRLMSLPFNDYGFVITLFKWDALICRRPSDSDARPGSVAMICWLWGWLTSLW